MRTLIVLIAAAFVSTTAKAQTTLVGTVREASGAVLLPGVTVEASSLVLTGKSRTAITDSAGHYRLENLGPDTYTVTFTLPGFSTLKVEDVDLSTSGSVTMDAEMRISSIAGTFIVACGMPVVEGDAAIDPKMPKHPVASAPKPAMRVVPAPACRK